MNKGTTVPIVPVSDLLTCSNLKFIYRCVFVLSCILTIHPNQVPAMAFLLKPVHNRKQVILYNRLNKFAK